MGAIPSPEPSCVGSISSWTVFIKVLVALLNSEFKIVNNTVPPPCHIGVTFVEPTPAIALVF